MRGTFAVAAIAAATAAAHADPPPPLVGDVGLIVTPDAHGHPAFVAAIAQARRSVRLAMFHLTDREVIAALIAARARGVDVKVLLDGASLGGGSRYAKLAAVLAANGVAVKPSSTGFSITHEKALLVDDAYVLVTAINLTHTAQDTRDFGVALHDPGVIAEVAEVFDVDWASADTGAATTPKLVEPHLVWSPVDSEDRLAALAGGARTTLIATVENLGDAKMQAAFGAAAAAGARVRLIVPMCDKDPDPTHNFPHVYALARAGVEVRVMPPPPSKKHPYMHSKMLLADGASAYVGSVNFSTNSMTRAREVGLVFADAPALAQIAAIFEQDWAAAIPPPAAPPTNCGTSGD